jgi:hypothetical protein
LRSSTVSRFRHFATVFGLIPSSRLNCAGEACDRCTAALTACPRHGARTIYGWLPRGKGFSWHSGVWSVAAIYSASVCSAGAARPDESPLGCYGSRSMARAQSAPVRTGYSGSLSVRWPSSHLAPHHLVWGADRPAVLKRRAPRRSQSRFSARPRRSAPCGSPRRSRPVSRSCAAGAATTSRRRAVHVAGH